MKTNIKTFLYSVLLVFSGLTLASDSIVIGLDADMSSVAAEGGTAIKRGALIAIDEINRQGGVLGRKLELQVKDHRGNPARGLDNIEQFARVPNLVAVLGGVHTPVALYELNAIHQYKLIYLSPWAAGTPVVDNGFEPNFVFRVSVRDEYAGPVILKEAKGNGINKLTLVLERTGWGRSNEKSMTQAAQALGLTINNIIWFNWGEQSFRMKIKESINSGSEAFVLVANTPEGATFIKDLAKFEDSKQYPVFSHWGITGGNFVEQVSLETLSKVELSVLQTFSFLNAYDQEKANSIIKTYNQLFDEQRSAATIPSAPGVAHAYDLIHLLSLAIKKAGTIERKKVQLELEKLKGFKGMVKHYQSPFNIQMHDALVASDYQMCRFNENGNLIPNVFTQM